MIQIDDMGVHLGLQRFRPTRHQLERISKVLGGAKVARIQAVCVLSIEQTSSAPRAA